MYMDMLIKFPRFPIFIHISYSLHANCDAKVLKYRHDKQNTPKNNKYNPTYNVECPIKNTYILIMIMIP